MSGKTNIRTNRKKRFEHIELPAKLLDYFLRSNKSNINQKTRLKDIDVTDLVEVCDRSRLAPEMVTDVVHQMFVWLKYAIPDSSQWTDAWGLVTCGGIVFSLRSAIDGTFLQVQVGCWDMDLPCCVNLQFGADSDCVGLQYNAICDLDDSLIFSNSVALDGMSISFWSQ